MKGDDAPGTGTEFGVEGTETGEAGSGDGNGGRVEGGWDSEGEGSP